MKNLIYIAILSFLTAFISTDAYSQRDTTRDKFKKIVKEKLKEKLQIDDNTIDEYIRLYTTHRKAINELAKQRKDVLDYIENNLDASDLSQKIDEVLSIDAKMVDLRKDFIISLKNIMTPKQIAQTIIFQKKLLKFMSGERKKRKGRENE